MNPAQFTVYPAIDVLGGKCVRLMRGDYEAKTEYSDSPQKVAKQWLDMGAEFLHVVDLDGAKAGRPVNTSAIGEVVQAATAAGAKVQVGGGIRDYETLSQWLDLGVTRCVIGTAALDLKWMEGAVERFGAERLVVGLDGRDGKMAVHGWTEQTEVSLVSMAQQLLDVGVRYALVTDVARDGTLSGANIEIAKAIQATGMQAIASGGVRSVDDVLAAKQAGLAGVIAGRSLYDGTLDLREAIRVAKGVKTC